MMTQTLLNQAEIDGWRGEIRDGEVVKTHEDAVKDESEEESKDEPEEESKDESEESAAESVKS